MQILGNTDKAARAGWNLHSVWLLAPVLATLLYSVGCGAGMQASSGVADPPPATPSSSARTYTGTQSVDQGQGGAVLLSEYLYGGVWNVTLDDTSNYLSYLNVGHVEYGVSSSSAGPTGFPGSNAGLLPAVPTVGDFSTVNGFLVLNSNTPPNFAGYAVEVPGDAISFEPGSLTSALQQNGIYTAALVVGADMQNCDGIKGTNTYQFISLGVATASETTPAVAYGSVQASNSGATWNFSNLKMFTFDGTTLSPTPVQPGDCALTQEGYAVTTNTTFDLPGFINTVTGVPVPVTVPVTVAISPSGYFVMDQGQGDPSLYNSHTLAATPTGPFGLVGVQQPSSQINTANVIAAKYVGFEYDSILPDYASSESSSGVLKTTPTLPVTFGQGTVGSGSVMRGGDFPNNDVTKTPNNDITIDLGAEDPQNNGLYTSVTVTVPDTYGSCLQQTYGGKDANGNPTCIFHGDAIVGNPNGKFVVFVTVQDVSEAARHATTQGALGFYLYQQ